MAYRFTNTDKWQDSWFSELPQLHKLLFLYLCDNCDIAGFAEINIKRWCSDLGSSKETIEGALKGLQRGLIYSITNDCIYIRNFLKHQKNLPLNEKNKSHLGIIRRFELYSYKFDIKDINEFIEGASKGLQSPSGNGNGTGIDKGNIKTWKTDFEIYLSDLRKEYSEIIKDKEYISRLEEYHPKLNIILSIEKSCFSYWATNEGWQNKKKKKTETIDWKSTFSKTITLNAVYK